MTNLEDIKKRETEAIQNFQKELHSLCEKHSIYIA
jgi:hypothetical protein